MGGRVSLQKYALGGKPPGPFFRNLPIFPRKFFHLAAWIRTTFQLAAARSGTFRLPAQVEEPFRLEV